MTLSLMILLGYILGSIPFGLILTKFMTGIDVRTIGSGNIGATNVLRSGHILLAVLTFILDALKGSLAVLIYRFNATVPTTENELIIAAAAVLGHLYPLFLYFRGGKGVATSAGCLLVVAPLVGITAIALWVITIFLTRRSALAALIATILLPFYAYFLSGFSLMVWSFAISSLVIYKHKDNISRLCQGTESRIDFSTPKNPL